MVTFSNVTQFSIDSMLLKRGKQDENVLEQLPVNAGQASFFLLRLLLEKIKLIFKVIIIKKCKKCLKAHSACQSIIHVQVGDMCLCRGTNYPRKQLEMKPIFQLGPCRQMAKFI